MYKIIGIGTEEMKNAQNQSLNFLLTPCTTVYKIAAK
jgi:hypothetical protein